MTDILIIEDNQEISALLHDFIVKAGYSCMVKNSGEMGLMYLQSTDVGIVLLDIMLPGIDGFAVCDAIHQEKNLPIIILSARTAKEDQLNGLLLGADDYIEKPYDMDLLLAKIATLYRRHYGGREQTILKAGPITLDMEGRNVYLKKDLLTLTIKEYELLKLLVQNNGKVLRKEYIFDQVWGYDSFSEPSTLTVHVKWLREKIEKDPKNPGLIQTAWGVGYKFMGDGYEEI